MIILRQSNTSYGEMYFKNIAGLKKFLSIYASDVKIDSLDFERIKNAIKYNLKCEFNMMVTVIDHNSGVKNKRWINQPNIIIPFEFSY